MTPIPIDDPADQRIALYRNLTDAELRRATEAEHSVFVAEGKLVVRRLAHSSLGIRSLLVATNRLDSLADFVDRIDAPVYVGSPDILASVTGFDVHRGVLAIGERPPARTIEQLAPAATSLAVLEDVTDQENVGALARSACGLGIDGLVLSPRCGDPYSRRALRVSMGALLELPHARSTRWPDDLEELRRSGFVLWALTPSGDVDLRGLAVPPRIALLLGTEGAGLSDATLARADERVAIRIRPGSDSLNVAAAAAIAFHHLGRC